MEPPFDVHREMIHRLVERCKAAKLSGATPDEIRSDVLRYDIERLIKESSPQDFLEWIKDDREYSYYYFDAQQSGVCAKPPEVVAMILESITLDALE